MNQLFEDLPEPKTIKRVEPKSRYDYCKVIASMLKKSIGYVLGRTKGFNMNCFWQMESDCKQLTTKEAKIKYLMYFLREAQLK